MTCSKEAEYKEVVHAVNCGDNKAKTKLAWFLLSGRGGATVDADRAVVLLEERVKDGDDEAMWMLGLCNEYGIGTERNVERAGSLYERSGSVSGKLLAENDEGGRGSGNMIVKSELVRMTSQLMDIIHVTIYVVFVNS